MNKEKNHLTHKYRRPLKWLLGLMSLPVIAFIIVYTLVYMPMAFGYVKAYRMVFWEMPPETQIDHIKVTEGSGGNSYWVWGELTIKSKHSWEIDELEDFFDERYYPEYKSGFNTIYVQSEDSPDPEYFYYSVHIQIEVD